MKKLKLNPRGGYADMSMGPWQMEATLYEADDELPGLPSIEDMTASMMAEAEALLNELGYDWNPDGEPSYYIPRRKNREVTPDLTFAGSVLNFGKWLIEGNYESPQLAMLVGSSYAEMRAAALWRQKLAKGGRKQGRKLKDDEEAGLKMLRAFIEAHGPVPPTGEKGKLNPLRTKYREKFLRESGLTISRRTFDRWVKICAEQIYP